MFCHAWHCRYTKEFICQPRLNQNCLCAYVSELMVEIISSIQKTVVLLLLHEFKFSSVGNFFQKKFQQLSKCRVPPDAQIAEHQCSEVPGITHACTRNNVNPVLVKANSHWSQQELLPPNPVELLPCNFRLLEGFSVLLLKCIWVIWKSSSFLDLLGWVMGNWVEFCASCGWLTGFVCLKNNLPEEISIVSLSHVDLF